MRSVRKADIQNPSTGNSFARRIIATVVIPSLLLFLGSTSLLGQSVAGDETPEETLSRSTQNLHLWGTISSFHGLPSERVRAITQTDDGFIWFGTENGLASFDGRLVETNISSVISSRAIRDLEVDGNDVLWVATDRGLFYRRESLFFPVKGIDETPINSITLVDGRVYATNEEGKVFLCSTTGDTYTATNILNGDTPLRTSTVIGTEVYLGSQNSGLLKLENRETKPVFTKPRPFFINSIERDSTGKLWIGAESSAGSSGLFTSKTLPDLSVVGENLGTVNTIAFDRLGDAWVGTDKQGLFHFSKTKLVKRFSFQNTAGSLRSNQILAAFIDREGVVWVGTDKGVNRYDPYSPKNERVSSDTQSNFVRFIATSKTGTTLVGTNRGLYQSQGEGSGWKTVLPEKTTYVIESLSEEKWLVGGPSGLSLYDQGSGETETLVEDIDVRDVKRFKGDLYVAAFEIGLIKLTDNGYSTLSKEAVVSVFADDSKILFGTTDGKLFEFDGESVSKPTTIGDESGAAIWSISGDSKDGIWLSTNQGLFFLIDGTVQQLVSDFNIRQTQVVRPEKGRPTVWCASEQGLISLVYDDEQGWISSSSDIDQGFASSNMFSVTKVKNNSLAIATTRGVIRKTIEPTKPLITASRILSRRIHQESELKTGVVIDYPQNTLTVEITPISSRSFPEEFQYSFALFGPTGELTRKRITAEEEFLIDNLDPGTHRVKIIAYDRNLNASDPLIFDIRVENAPFPIIATTLGILLLIAIAALIWAFFSQKASNRTSKKLAVANSDLNSARLDLANEAERERKRIARDLHDQTLADLRHLILMADNVTQDNAGKFRGEIEEISDEIRRICEDLSPSVLENIGFTAAIEWELSTAVNQVAEEGAIETEFHADDSLDEKLDLNRAEEIQIYRIAQEVLSNIVRHADPTKIVVRLEIDGEGKFMLLIRDNGNPFNPPEVPRKESRGLTNIRARAQLIHAEMNWRRLDTDETVFTLEKAGKETNKQENEFD